MWMRKSWWFSATAGGLAALFTWLVCGGQRAMEVRAALRNPAQFFARMASDPRLPLTSAQRCELRDASLRLARPAPSQPPVAPPAGPAANMRQLGVELAALGEAPAAASRPAPEPAMIAELRGRFGALDRQAQATLAEADALVSQPAVSDVMRERQAAARAKYLAEAAAVTADLDAAAFTTDPAAARSALADAAGRLATSGDRRPQQRFDPAHLSFRRATPTARQPGQPVFSGGRTAVASRSLSLAAAATSATPTDLSPNEDVQITPEITALAASLGNQPLAIYNWVHDNIEFVPTYGSVQGSQMTLEAKRGNAFDTASLLIALLRAADIHARYVLGTIDVPTQAAMNWVGGVASTSEAQQMLGLGGIPTIALVAGGAVTALRIDHVWVEAFVDFEPSRGAIHRQGDTWVPMDASFKQHTFTARSGVFAANPIASSIAPGVKLFDTDESLGKISNFDDQPFNDGLEAWVSANTDYFNAHTGERTPDGILGAQAVIVEAPAFFSGALPYKIHARQGAADMLPPDLRHTVTVTGYGSALDVAFGDADFTVQISLPALNSKRLGVEFDPATPADASALAAARAPGATSLPVYLFQVLPTLKLDGVALGSGTARAMGSEYHLDITLGGPDGNNTVSYSQIAGDEIVLGVTGNGVAQGVLEKRFSAHPVDNAAEYLQQVQMHYWLESDVVAQMSARAQGAHLLRLPSVGLFSSPLTVSYFFGFPHSGYYGSRNMDVKSWSIGVASDDPVRAASVARQAGYGGSYLEGSVFDQLEQRASPTEKGVSAVQLLASAAHQGIPLYRVTAQNAAAVMPLLSLDEAVTSDISAAVANGQTVLVSQHNVDQGLWHGAGYIVRDEATGAGAYLISGGLAGGGMPDCLKQPSPIFTFVLQVLFFLLLTILLAILIAGLWEIIPVLAGAGAAALEGSELFVMLQSLAPFALGAT